MVKRLIEVLEQEVELYEELLHLLQEEKRFLSVRKREELHLIANKIETLVFKVKGIEGVRNGVVGMLAKSYGLDAEESGRASKVNLSMLINSVEVFYRPRLKVLQSNLLSLLDGIGELNRGNSRVISRSIENIRTAFLFLRELSMIDTYSPSGKVNGMPAKGA